MKEPVIVFKWFLGSEIVQIKVRSSDEETHIVLSFKDALGMAKNIIKELKELKKIEKEERK